jgi:hypothetical protein
MFLTKILSPRKYLISLSIKACRMKYHCILLLLLFLFACNTASKKTAADSSIIEGVKELVPVAPPPAVDRQAAQVQAQDTIFADGPTPPRW